MNKDGINPPCMAKGLNPEATLWMTIYIETYRAMLEDGVASPHEVAQDAATKAITAYKAAMEV